MKHKLLYSPEAQRDLDAISEYITGELANPESALQVVLRILDAAERLEQFPKSGAPLASVTRVPGDYRFIPAEAYLIFYRVQGQAVHIDRILYHRRDYMRILFEEQENT